MELEKQLYKFFRENNISMTIKKISKNYLDSFRIEKDITPVTIRNNAKILFFTLKNIGKDLNTLSEESIKKYKISVNNHKNEKTGKPASTSTKKMYRVGFAQFLRWAAKEWDKPAYNEFAEGMKYKVKTEGKNPNDLLTKEEIDRMINVAARGRDQAILLVLAESGCRVGELVSSRIGDVKPAGDFTRLTFRKGKTGLRTVPLKESIIYLNEWLRVHPYKYDPDASLWVSKYKIPPHLYSVKEFYAKF